jgi:hypothetical protein
MLESDELEAVDKKKIQPPKLAHFATFCHARQRKFRVLNFCAAARAHQSPACTKLVVFPARGVLSRLLEML